MDAHLGKLKAKSLKFTPRRQAIIRLFAGCKSHLTAEEVWNKIKKKFDHCGLPGVYRNLENLVYCGILTRVQQFDRRKHYGLCTAEHGRHHHHIVCVKCGKVEEMPGCGIAGKKKIKGYTVVSHYMQVNGICGSCSGK
ncbi:MAG: transcriptional repressor [Candidatus Omnitrophota bacterium]